MEEEVDGDGAEVEEGCEEAPILGRGAGVVSVVDGGVWWGWM